ncbi:peptidyl-prolyl cis-trans isomerase fkbp16-3 chloroplastic [Phtheirospermum japonicum]|uniref:peptidylprolyl isomerase n=1 Tax=Phtheirospermum japonicum TaxID=374723 RepID=A0A830CAS1_9LAMI|nr:peptidyl-prolyl cis-trans isomerase fkbp16-3 chloroplastic [Phtheirospermum japonicum]
MEIKSLARARDLVKKEVRQLDRTLDLAKLANLKLEDKLRRNQRKCDELEKIVTLLVEEKNQRDEKINVRDFANLVNDRSSGLSKRGKLRYESKGLEGSDVFREEMAKIYQIATVLYDVLKTVVPETKIDDQTKSYAKGVEEKKEQHEHYNIRPLHTVGVKPAIMELPEIKIALRAIRDVDNLPIFQMYEGKERTVNDILEWLALRFGFQVDLDAQLIVFFLNTGDDACEKELENVPMVTTESGLQYKDIKVGSGPSPPVGFQVAANYVAMVPSGQIFDSSLEKGQFYIFRVGAGQVIKGLDEGILSMRVGGKRRLYILGPLAFPKGLTSAPGRTRVAANSPVIFDVSLEYIPGLEDEE